MVTGLYATRRLAVYIVADRLLIHVESLRPDSSVLEDARGDAVLYETNYIERYLEAYRPGSRSTKFCEALPSTRNPLHPVGARLIAIGGRPTQRLS
jgi:hypothetical protein